MVGGRRVSEFFDKLTKNLNLNFFLGGRLGVGGYVNVGEHMFQMCHIILKSMHKCRSYGLDKLNL